MNLLGIDTSTSASAACVLRADGEAFELEPPPEALSAPPGHARDLLPAVAEVLRRSGLGWADVDRVAVGVGPGAFTGLRVGVATARGLAQAHGCELVPVSSLAALAAGMGAPLALPLIDARRGEVFAALYEEGREVWPPFAAPVTEVGERVGEAGLNPLAAGSGAVQFRLELEAAGLRAAPGDSGKNVVRALWICRLAAEAEPVSPEAVLPDYLRLPDAKPRT